MENDIPPPEAVETELQRILASPDFKNSARNRQFLRFVVDETLAGRGERLKAFSIAVGVLRRGADFDSNTDPIVRTLAMRVRRALEHYYLTTGKCDPLYVEIPLGSYRPVFLAPPSQPGPPLPASSPAETPNAVQPAIAVLPLVGLGGDPLAVFFADSLAHELVAALARFEGFRVLLSSSGAEPDAGFLLSGTVTRAASTLRLTTLLRDAFAGEALWSASYVLAEEDDKLFDVQARLSREIAALLVDMAGVIPRAIIRQTEGLPTSQLPLYSAVFRYLSTVWRFREEYLDARQVLEDAVARAPNHAFAHAMLGEAYIHDYQYMFGTAQDPLDRALALGRRAVTLNSTSQYAELLLATVYLQRHEFDQFTAHAERCLALNPDASYCVGHIGQWTCLAGEWEKGCALVRRAMGLNPNYPRYFHHALFLSHLRSGDYEQALAEARLFNVPGLFWGSLDRGAALGYLGRRTEGQAAVTELLALRPDFPGVARQLTSRFVLDDRLLDVILEGLRRAWPEAVCCRPRR